MRKELLFSVGYGKQGNDPDVHCPEPATARAINKSNEINRLMELIGSQVHYTPVPLQPLACSCSKRHGTE